jgi:hypothetical protein
MLANCAVEQRVGRLGKKEASAGINTRKNSLQEKLFDISTCQSEKTSGTGNPELLPRCKNSFAAI